VGGAELCPRRIDDFLSDVTKSLQSSHGVRWRHISGTPERGSLSEVVPMIL
jgi:hypothetical protein